jgi:hypothetical protein
MKGPLATLISCAIVLLVLVAADVSMRLWPSAGPPVVTTRSVEYIVPSDSLGWAPLPSTAARVTKTEGDRVVYEVTYAFDEHGRRIVPQDPAARYEKFLLFFGDSGTLGEGVTAEQSVPAQTARRLPGVRAYNYAFHGYSPQHVLAKVETTDLRAEVAEERGLAVYPFSAYLMDRLVGGSATLWWSQALPYYTVDGGALRRNGFYQTAMPVRTLALKLIGTSPLLERLHVRWPLKTTDADRELFCRVMASARDEIRRPLPGTDLIIALRPNDHVAPFACFTRYELRAVDLRDAYGDTPAADLKLRGDPHSSVLADELEAAALARDLEPVLERQRTRPATR